MRHASNARRGGRNHRNNNSSHSNYNNNGRRSPSNRVHTFDSNGPDVRIRGNAFQVNEKYLALARDAASAGDRVLAESYLQYAEHYQRVINELAIVAEESGEQPAESSVREDQGENSDQPSSGGRPQGGRQRYQNRQNYRGRDNNNNGNESSRQPSENQPESGKFEAADTPSFLAPKTESEAG